MLYHAIRASNKIARERGKSFGGFEKSAYASGEFFDKYVDKAWEPQTQKVRDLFGQADSHPQPGRLACAEGRRAA